MQTIRTNTKIGASTQYTNFDFNSFCVVDGTLLGASETGVFQLVGSTDNSVVIEAYFTPYTTNFGQLNDMRLRFIDLGVVCTGSIVVEATGSSKVLLADCTVVSRSDESDQRVRGVFEHTEPFSYASFTFRNTNGCDFLIDAADIWLYTLSYGRK